jgi:hypothetical protein
MLILSNLLVGHLFGEFKTPGLWSLRPFDGQLVLYLLIDKLLNTLVPQRHYHVLSYINSHQVIDHLTGDDVDWEFWHCLADAGKTFDIVTLDNFDKIISRKLKRNGL